MDPIENKIRETLQSAAADHSPRADHRAELRKRTLAAFDETQARQRAPRHILSLNGPLDWRTIMYHPISRWSAAALFLLAAGTVGWLVMAGPSQTALASFAEPLINAKTARLTVTSRVEGKVVVVAKMLVSDDRSRMEIEQQATGRKQITIMDGQRDIEFILLPAEKRAEIIHYKNRPAASKTGGFLAEVRKFLLDSKIDGKTTRESLGEREIDGRRLVGYRLANPGTTLELWGDAATGLPHSVVQTMSAYPSMTTTMSDFEFDKPFDESLLSLEPPADYEVDKREVDSSPPGEQDLVAALGALAELNQNVFPIALNMEVGRGLVRAFHQRNEGRLSADELDKKAQALQTKISRGFGFNVQFPKDQRRYTGEGVKLGAANKMIYWYQPKGKKTYRVIFADLTVADSDTKPAAE